MAKAARKSAQKSSQKSSQRSAQNSRKTGSSPSAVTSAKRAAHGSSKKSSKAASALPKPAAAKKTSKRAVVANAQYGEFMGLALRPWVLAGDLLNPDGVGQGRCGFVLAFGANDVEKIRHLLNDHLPSWMLENALVNGQESQFFHGENGPVWVLRAADPASSPGPLSKSDFARFRDLAGGIVTQLAPLQLDQLIFEFHDMSPEAQSAALVGLEMARYSYVENRDNPLKTPRKFPELRIVECSAALTREAIAAAGQLGVSVNLARHLVNLPGGELHPRAYADATKKLFARSSTVSVEIWEGARLVRERMNLMLAVGNGASEGPRLVHLRYRPRRPVLSRPIAIVGKGVTFDSGGLDIKPSSGMRLMKKDMGGSAAALALVKWAEISELPIALDIYLAVAENAISGSSFRPGDIITARNGLTIEIHNTDAEGRLVLADALDVAVSQKGKDEPLAVINIATLTGAIKVGLGGEIAGLFSNNDGLAIAIADAGLSRGDLSWRMPLYAPYRASLRSGFADFANASDGFGGAITAALFLELFVKAKPWAHMDVYAWKDSASGAWSEAGGNGQPVLGLAALLSRIASGEIAPDFTEAAADPFAPARRGTGARFIVGADLDDELDDRDDETLPETVG